METFDKIGVLFQAIASVLFILFSLFNFVRTIAQNSGCIYAICFAAMMYLSWNLFKISVKELVEIIRKGGDNDNCN